MKFPFIKYVLIILCFNKIISFKNYSNDIYEGKLILNLNNIIYNTFNITIHSALNYSYLLKYNFTTKNKNMNISFIENDNIHISFINNNESFYMYFLNNEDSVINLILNKSIDSILYFNYLIFTPDNISDNVGESLSHQLFYINKYNYDSFIHFIKIYNHSNISFNLFYDNTFNLIPYDYIKYSIKIPLYSIIVLIIIIKIFFNKSRYYNLCINSSILRIIFSVIYILITKEKINYNKNKFRYISGLSIDSFIDSINNLIKDIYLSFIFSSILFIINNETNLIHFFNANDRKIKTYFSIFLFLSLINIPNYLFNQISDIEFIDFVFLKIKKIVYEIMKIIFFIYFIKKQINIISRVLFFYSMYHITNNLNHLIRKKIFYKNIRAIFLVFIFYTFFLKKILFIKYRNNLYYWNIIDNCLSENFNSSIIFMFWLLMNMTEENNPILLILSRKRNYEIKNYNTFKFEIKNEITKNNYSNNRSNLNITIYKKYPLIILNPFVEKINNKNFERISVGYIE